MNTYEAILKRRSTRKFKKEKIKKEDIEKLIEAGDNAPSAMNRKPWIIYVIEDENILKQFDEIGKYSKMESPLSIVVVGNSDLFLEGESRDFAFEDLSAVTENILIMAEELNLGTCWNGVYPRTERVNAMREILNLKENLIPFALIRIGYKDEEKEPHSGYDNKRVVKL